MPISPWNPGGYFPFRYGAPTGAPNTSTTPVTAGLPISTGGGVGSSVGGVGSGSNVTGQAIANNLSAGPDLSSLTQLINNLNIAAQQQANAARIPGATGLETASSANIGSLLGGNIPQDVQTQLAQAAAERGVGIGSPGSDNVNSSLLRSLGLTSLDLQQLGQQDLTQAYARNPVAKLFDPTTQLITPYQQGELNNQANQLALEWYRALHPQVGGTGSRGGGGQQQQQPTTPDMSWFQRALQSSGGLNQPIGVAPIGTPPPITYPGTPYDPNYPGTSVPGLPPLTSILGTADPGYGLSPDPYGQPPYTPDASNQDYWNFSGDTSGLGDAFSLYGGG